MNSIISFHKQKEFKLEIVPLVIYWTIKNTDVDRTSKKILNYASNQYDLTYTSDTFISTESPFSNTNYGSMYVYGNQNRATTTTTKQYTLATATTRGATMSFGLSSCHLHHSIVLFL